MGEVNVELKCVRRTATHTRRSMLPPIALACFLFLLALLFTASPAYAGELTPNQFDDGGGVGGGGKVGSAYTIEGVVYDYETGSRASYVSVYLRFPDGFTFETETDSGGYFRFESYGIAENSDYLILVNAAREVDLGTWLIDYHWGQMAVLVHTNNNAYAYKKIRLQHATEVVVPAAALFSNTKYATLYYGQETESVFSHTINFKVTVVGINTGYKASTGASREFWADPLVTTYIGRKHYATTYWDDRKPGIVSSGIAHEVENTNWGTYQTNEYIDPNSLTEGYEDFQLINGTGVYAKYKETSSYTWSVSAGIDFAISYNAFDTSIGVDTTVTIAAGTTNWVSYKIYNTSGTTLIFRAYTAGAPLDTDDPDPEKHWGGMELHVWNMMGTG